MILGLASEEVEEVDNDPNDHCDLHVVVLPVGPETNMVTFCAKGKKDIPSKVMLRKVFDGNNIFIDATKISQSVLEKALKH